MKLENDVDVGPYYTHLIDRTNTKSERDDVATCVAFLMARLGPNMAESYNERQIHVSNQIMTADRTSMHDDILEPIVLLRMNSDWMHVRHGSFQEVLPQLDLGIASMFEVLD